MGINSRADLARSTRILRERINATHLANGVTLIDPETTYIDVDVRIGADTVIQPMTHLEGPRPGSVPAASSGPRPASWTRAWTIGPR